MSAQVAISLTLLAGALLLTRSMTARQSVDPGFDPSRVAQFSIDPATQRYDVAKTITLYTRLTSELRAIPGVRSAAQARWAPFSRNRTDGSFHSDPDGGTASDAEVSVVAGGYFTALGVPFVEGRDFTDAELFQSGPMPAETPAIVTESFARALFGGGSAVGRRFYGTPAHSNALAIVGVVRDFRHDRVTEPPERMIFEPSRVGTNSQATFLVGTSEPFAAEAVAARAREIVASIDPELPIFGVRTLADAVAADLAADRLVTMLATVFATLATLLAAVGLYSVIARSVAERRRELSIRVALGAAPSRIARLVASDAWRMGAFGVIAGLAATFWLSRYLESWLFGVAPRDPVSLAGALTLIAAVLFSAAFGPARRAARIDSAAELK